MIAGSEFSIGRIANVNNKTDYLLNDVPTRFGELAALMKSKGVDLDNNRFLILQVEFLGLQEVTFFEGRSGIDFANET